MAKNITITNVDNINVSDKSNMDLQPRKRIKMIHEQVFEQYGIDPIKVFERTGLLKNIPVEWISEIVISNIQSCKTPRVYQNNQLKDKTTSLGFETPEACEAFYKEFNINMSKSINNYITSKNENPQKYNRIVVIESTVSNKQLTIRY